MPNQRDLELRTLDEVAAEARRLHESGYEMGGDWDLSQIATHVAQPMTQTLDGFTMKANPFLRFFLSTFIKPGLFRSRKVRPGVKAPPGFEPAPSDEAEAVAALEQAIERIKSHEGPWPVHPFFGKLTPEEWIEFHTIHGQHHLSFLHPKSGDATSHED